MEDSGFISTGMNEIFQKIRIKTERWASTGNKYFPNVFSRALAAKTYLVLQFKYLSSNATLEGGNLKDIQKYITLT